MKQVEKFSCFGVAITSNKAKRKIGCSIRQSKRCNASFALFSRFKTRAIKKSKTLGICPHSHLWLFLARVQTESGMTEKVRSQMQASKLGF